MTDVRIELRDRIGREAFQKLTDEWIAAQTHDPIWRFGGTETWATTEDFDRYYDSLETYLNGL